MAAYNCSQGTFSGKGNIEIFYEKWIAERAKAIVVIVHGLGEHSGRYSNIIETASGKGISFYALDHRGHGRSKGISGHVDSFMDYILDLKIFVNGIKAAYPDLPVLMLGHSLGGAIACRYALTYQDDLSGLILSSAGFMPALEIPFFKKKSAAFLSALFPTMEMESGLDPNDLSHDEAVIKNYIEDPLVHSVVTPRFYTEFTENAAFCLDHVEQIRIPLLVIHGEDDKICRPEGSQIVFDRADSQDKQIIIFPGLYHETMNETLKQRTKVLSAVSKWFVAHSHSLTHRSSPVKAAAAGKKAVKAKGKKIVRKKA